jgi:hypothetical protein
MEFFGAADAFDGDDVAAVELEQELYTGVNCAVRKPAPTVLPTGYDSASSTIAFTANYLGAREGTLVAQVIRKSLKHSRARKFNPFMVKVKNYRIAFHHFAL